MRVCHKMKGRLLPWEFRTLTPLQQAELIEMWRPEIEYDLEQAEKRREAEENGDNT